MRILRVRRGFQADHSSSSYLFHAIDRPVSAKGQMIARRFSSRAEVDEEFARYVKWGDASLSSSAYKELLDEHYDVMAEESYGWWTLMIAVPKTAEMKAALAPFTDARGDSEQGVEVEEFSKRLAVKIYCQFIDDGVNLLDDRDGDILEALVERLAKVRAELLKGDTSFLTAVTEFYGAFDEDEEKDEDEPSDDADDPSLALFENMKKAELQRECERRGIAFLKSWTKAQFQAALAKPIPTGVKGKAKAKAKGKPKLSRAAKAIVSQLDYQ